MRPFYILVGYAMKIKLECCPFCGSSEVVDRILFPEKIIFIRCNDCGCRGPFIHLDITSESVVNSVDSGLKETAILWNKRSLSRSDE